MSYEPHPGPQSSLYPLRSASPPFRGGGQPCEGGRLGGELRIMHYELSPAAAVTYTAAATTRAAAAEAAAAEAAATTAAACAATAV